MEKPILVVAHVGAEKSLLVEKILLERGLKNEDVIIISPEQAKERGIIINQIEDIRNSKSLSIPIIETYKNPDSYKSGRENRRERRKKERKRNKK